MKISLEFRTPFFGGLIIGDELYVDINERQEESMKKSLIFFYETLFTSNVVAEVYSVFRTQSYI